MTSSVPGFRVIRLIAIAGLITFASLIGAYIFNAAIQPTPSDGPVEKWIQAGIDLHRVDELFSMNVFGKGEYKAEYERVLSEAKQIAHDSEFPGTNEAYAAYKDERVKDLRWPAVFWCALAIALIVSISAFSWLHGASLAVFSLTDKAAEQNAEPELPTTGF